MWNRVQDSEEEGLETELYGEGVGVRLSTAVMGIRQHTCARLSASLCSVLTVTVRNFCKLGCTSHTPTLTRTVRSVPQRGEFS